MNALQYRVVVTKTRVVLKKNPRENTKRPWTNNVEREIAHTAQHTKQQRATKQRHRHRTTSTMFSIVLSVGVVVVWGVGVVCGDSFVVM